jgi:hypothetical protein
VKLAPLAAYQLIVVSALLSSCATPPATVNHPAPPAPPPPVVQTPPVAPPVAPVVPAVPATDTAANERALAAALAAYERGDFSGATRLLTPLTNDNSLDAAQQIRALKTLAFSQCSTGATTACRQTFERAFRADANFELATAERGHPIWGPQFERARRTVLGR